RLWNCGAISVFEFTSTRPTAVFLSCSPTKTRRLAPARPRRFAPSRIPTAGASTPPNKAWQLTGAAPWAFPAPGVGRFYKHDSPFTYFTSADLHLGEISLECSRAGAAAAALWATLKCFPLESEAGLGAVLRKTRKAALEWARLIEASDELRLILQ